MFNSSDDWIAPTITGAFGLVLAVLAFLLARRGAKLDSVANRAPDVQEMWVQQEADRRMRRLVEDLWWNTRQAFKTYYRRVTTAIIQLNLPPERAALFELTKKELAAIEARLPEDTPTR